MRCKNLLQPARHHSFGFTVVEMRPELRRENHDRLKAPREISSHAQHTVAHEREVSLHDLNSRQLLAEKASRGGLIPGRAMLKRDFHKPLDRVALLLEASLWNVEAIDFILPTIVEECAGPLDARLRRTRCRSQ
jgi:hypothetical protein